MDYSSPFSNLAPPSSSNKPTFNQSGTDNVSNNAFLVKKRTSLFGKKTPLLAAGGLMAFLILAAAGMALSGFQKTTDTRSQASAAKTAQLIVEPKYEQGKQVFTVYLDGSQLPSGTKIVNFSAKFRLLKAAGDPQPRQVLGDRTEITETEADQIAATTGISCGELICPVGYACVTATSRPMCIRMGDGGGTPSPSPVIHPVPTPSPRPSLKPSPTPSPTPGSSILGTYETLSVLSLTRLFNFQTPRFSIEGVTRPSDPTIEAQLMPGFEYLVLNISGSVNTRALGKGGYAQLLKKVSVFTITNSLAEGAVQYNVTLESQSIKGYRRGVSALVELTSQVRPSPVPPSPQPTPTIDTGAECQRCETIGTAQNICDPELVCKTISAPVVCPAGVDCAAVIIPTPTCVKPDGTSKCETQPTPPTSPTPSPNVCSAILTTYDFVEPCTNGYRYIKYTCSDGYSTSMGGATSCKPKDLWISYAKSACLGRKMSCGAQSTPVPTPTPPPPPSPRVLPTVTPSPVPSPVPVQY